MSEFQLIIKPDEEEADGAEVYVDGTLGGKAYRFLFDTGAASSSVTFDDYTSTFQVTEQKSSSGVFAESNHDLITVPSLEVGPISRQNVTVVRSAAGDPHVRNLIGMDLLKDLCCHFFFDENHVLVEDDVTVATDYPFQAMLLDQRFHPYVDVQFETANAKAVWDTGASITIGDMGFIRSHAAYFQEAGQSTGTDSTGSQMETPMFLMAASIIGGCEFPPVRVAGVDLSRVNATIEIPMDLILGYNILSKAHWLMDFPRKKWAISKINPHPKSLSRTR